MIKKNVPVILMIIFIGVVLGCANQQLRENREFGISVTELQYQLQSTASPIVIDVRTSEEYYAGHLPGARLFPAKDIFMNTAQIPADQAIVLYCSDGQRSLLVAKHLHSHGYSQVKRLNGGIKTWPGEVER